jgi:heme O synthase-like polyprenyltransferase
MLPAVFGERSAAWAIGISTAIVALSSVAFAFTDAFHGGYLIVAAAAGSLLLYLAAIFVRSPTPERAWNSYKFSGIYLTVLLVTMMADALVPLRFSL